MTEEQAQQVNLEAQIVVLKGQLAEVTEERDGALLRWGTARDDKETADRIAVAAREQAEKLARALEHKLAEYREEWGCALPCPVCNARGECGATSVLDALAEYRSKQ